MALGSALPAKARDSGGLGESSGLVLRTFLRAVAAGDLGCGPDTADRDLGVFQGVARAWVGCFET